MKPKNESNNLGYFAIRTDGIRNIDNDTLPILDITHFGIAEKLTDKSQETVLSIMIEKIIYLAKKVSDYVGCPFVRIYEPINYENDRPVREIDQKIFSNYGFVSPKFLKKKKRVFQKRLVMRYWILSVPTIDTEN